MSTIINPVSDDPSPPIAPNTLQKPFEQQIQSINPIILLKQPQLYKQTFKNLTISSQQHLRSKQWQKGIISLNKTLQMLDFGKNILKDNISVYLKLTIYMNLAYAYHLQRKLQKCNRFCEKAKEELERLIRIVKKEEYSIGKYLKLSKALVTLKFQHCAIISQLEQHEKALQMCKSTVPELKQQIQIMLTYLHENISSKLLQIKSGQTVQFSKHVQKFAISLLNQLISFINQPLKKSHFYHWQKNPQQNQTQIKRRFLPHFNQNKNQCKRSILGVNKSSHWIDEFNIGLIMHMKLVKVDDFENVLPMEEYFFKDKLYEIVILCSLSYFTMATEIRFIEPSKEKEKEKEKDQGENKQSDISSKSQGECIQKMHEHHFTHNNINNTSNNSSQPQSPAALNILKKYGYQQRSQLFKLSQLYHLRAIQIISKNIQSIIPYLSHIIKSYQKHYLKKKQLQPITAILQQSQMSSISRLNESVLEYMPQKIQDYHYQNGYDFMKKSTKMLDKQNEEISDQMIQSQQNRSIPLVSKNNSEMKKSGYIQQEEENLQRQTQEEQNQQQSQPYSETIQQQSKSHENKEKQQKQSQQVTQSNQIISNEYLQCKKPENKKKGQKLDFKKSQKSETKRLKSKSKLKLNKIKSKTKKLQENKSLIGTLSNKSLKNKQLYFNNEKQKQKSSHKNIYTHRQKQQKPQKIKPNRQTSRQSSIKNEMITNSMTGNTNKNASPIHSNQLTKVHSPDINHQLKLHNKKSEKAPKISAKSKQKLLKKFIGVPQAKKLQQQHDGLYNSKKQKNTQKTSENNKKQHNNNKKQQKYFTTYDGEKQYRIKHQSTTHIKVVFKKKD